MRLLTKKLFEKDLTCTHGEPYAQEALKGRSALRFQISRWREGVNSKGIYHDVSDGSNRVCGEGVGF